MNTTFFTYSYLLTVREVTDLDLNRMLFGEVTKDETDRFGLMHRVITSPIIKTESDLIFYTYSGSRYVCDAPPIPFSINFREWQFMRDMRVSPVEVVALRSLTPGLPADLTPKKQNK